MSGGLCSFRCRAVSLCPLCRELELDVEPEGAAGSVESCTVMSHTTHAITVKEMTGNVATGSSHASQVFEYGST